MDKRGREATKRYRESNDGVSYLTISLTLNKELIKAIDEKKVHYENNRSELIEELTLPELKHFKKPIPNKSKHNQSLKEKITSTFTENFVLQLKKLGNMSFIVNDILCEKFNIEIN